MNDLLTILLVISFSGASVTFIVFLGGLKGKKPWKIVPLVITILFCILFTVSMGIYLVTNITFAPICEHEWKTVERAPTCITDGYTKEVCQKCDAVEKERSLPAYGHTMKEISRVEPTYAETGMVELHCTNCVHVRTEYLQSIGNHITTEPIQDTDTDQISSWGTFVTVLVIGLIVLAFHVIKLFKNSPRVPRLYPKSVTEELSKIDSLDGHSFEHYIARLLRAYGFENVSVTQGSGDYGVDIIAYAGEEKIAIQCKHYAKPVGIKAVQEVYAGKMHYNAAEAVVVTNSTFTDAAFTLAQETGVCLWDRDSLKRMLTEIIEREKQAANTSSK